MVDTPTPVAIAPVNGATLNTSQPVLEMTFAKHSSNQKAEWQLATDNAFTANVRTVTQPDSAFTSGSYASQVCNGLSTLNAQGTWFVRGRSISSLGVPSSWTAVSQVTVTHPPSAASLSPSADQTIAYASGTVAHKWNFFDTSPDDYQTAYQIQIEKNIDGSLLLDSGKVTSQASEYDYAIPPEANNTRVRWRVKLWDKNDVPGNWSTYETYWISEIPVVNITSPVNGDTLSNSSPSVAYSLSLGAGRSQVYRRVVFANSDTGEIAHDSNWIESSDQVYVPPPGILENLSSYDIEVEVQDDLGNVGSGVVTISTEWVAPETPLMAVDADVFTDHGYIRVTWTDAQQDVSFVKYQLFRQRDGETEWELVADESEQKSTYAFNDYLAAANRANRYRLIQVATRYGSEVSSAPVTRTVLPAAFSYWLIVKDNPSLNVKFSPNGDSYNDEWESVTNHLIGRGRQKEIGDRLGYTGTLDLKLRDKEDRTAREQKQKFEALAGLTDVIYLKNPFGDVWLVAPGSIQVTRIAGVGLSEFTDISVPYEELSE